MINVLDPRYFVDQRHSQSLLSARWLRWKKQKSTSLGAFDTGRHEARRGGDAKCPSHRYFLWVGSVLLALLFIADACLPNLPAGKLTTDRPSPAIRIHSERKWPERIVFDSSAPMPRLPTDASSVQGNPVQQTAAVIPDRAREALARLQISDVVQITAGSPKKQEARAQRQQKITKRRVARPVLRVARQPQYAWFGGRMWW